MNFQSIKLILLRLLIFFLPFGVNVLYTHIVDDSVLYGFDLILFLLYALWIVESNLFFKGGLIKTKFTGVALVKVFWSTLSLIPAISLTRGGIGVFMLVKAFLIYFYILNHIKSRRTFEIVVHWLMVGLLFQGVVGVLQYLTGRSLGLGFLGERQMTFHRTLSRVRGTLGYPNQFGAFIVMIIPMAISLFVFTQRGYKKTFYGVTALCSLFTLVLCFSRSAWAGLLVGTAIFVFILAKRRLLNIRFVFAAGAVLVTIGVLVAAFWDLILLRFETGSDPKYRVKMIEMAIPMMLDNPIFGVGLFNYEFHSMAEFRFWHPVHNDYLRLGAETGVPGLLLFLLILLLPLRQAIKMLNCRDKFLFAVSLGAMCGMVAMMVAINFGPEYQNYRVKILFWVLAALVYSIPRVLAHTERVKKTQLEKMQKLNRNGNQDQETRAGLSQKRR